MPFPESQFAHRWIDPIEALGGKGVEFGPAAHNPFGFKRCIYADREQPQSGSDYHKEQLRLAGEVLTIDVVAELGRPLPFATAEFDYIVTSHVLEHAWDLIGAFNEMKRILKPYGLMIHVVPHVERTFDKGRPLTTWAELQARHANAELNPEQHGIDCHHSVFDTSSFLQIAACLDGMKVLDFLDVDDKVGNGFMVAMQLRHAEEGKASLGNQEILLPRRLFCDIDPHFECEENVAEAMQKQAREREFKEMLSIAAQTGLERNAPCPCGSGKRYKHCHGRSI